MQFARYVWKSEPRRNLAPFVQARSQIGSRDAEDARATGHFIFRKVCVLVFQIGHVLKGHHGDADLFFMSPEQLLRCVGTIKGLPVLVVARTSVVPTHDEMAAAVVFADDGVPNRFPRPAHAHGERQKRELYGVSRIFRKQRLVASDANVILDISGFRHAHRRMKKEICFHFLGCPQSQFLMSAMHGVAGLESNDPSPAEPNELGTQVGRSEPHGAKIVMVREVKPFELAPDAPRLSLLRKMVHSGMMRAGSPVDSSRLRCSIRFPNFLHVQGRKHHAFGIAKSNGGSCSNGSRKLVRNVEDDGNRPNLSVGEAHSGAGTFVIGA